MSTYKHTPCPHATPTHCHTSLLHHCSQTSQLASPTLQRFPTQNSLTECWLLPEADDDGSAVYNNAFAYMFDQIYLCCCVCRWAAVKCFSDTGRQTSSTTAATSFIKRSSPVRKVTSKITNRQVVLLGFICLSLLDTSVFVFLLLVSQLCAAGWPGDMFIAD